jgi:signal transduction histidine kinase
VRCEAAPYSTEKRSVPGIRLSVEDEGIGVPEEELEAIFDKFVQSSKSKTGEGGTGLGLSICREIVRGHGGRIWAENREEGGTRLAFHLPCRASALHAREPLAVNDST